MSAFDTIPGGMGTASLFLRRHDLAVCFKDAEGSVHEVYLHQGAALPGEAVFAVHLGETLPIVDDCPLPETGVLADQGDPT